MVELFSSEALRNMCRELNLSATTLRHVLSDENTLRALRLVDLKVVAKVCVRVRW